MCICPTQWRDNMHLWFIKWLDRHLFLKQRFEFLWGHKIILYMSWLYICFDVIMKIKDYKDEINIRLGQSFYYYVMEKIKNLFCLFLILLIFEEYQIIWCDQQIHIRKCLCCMFTGNYFIKKILWPHGCQ